MSESIFLAYLGLTVLTFLLIVVHVYYENAYKYWWKRGVGGPKPLPIIGNLAHLAWASRKYGLAWMQKYGKVYGIYEGHRPALVVADPEALRQLVIKDFALMPDHLQLGFLKELPKNFLLWAQGEQWRKQRTLMSGTFTSGKVRRMFKLLDICAEDMLMAFREQLDGGNTTVNLKDLFGLYTLDAIASCCYGLKMKRYTLEGGLKRAATRDELVNDAMKIFDFKIWRIVVVLCVSTRLLDKLGFDVIPKSTLIGFSTRIQNLVRKRRTSGKHFDDYLQTLLDAKLDDDDTAPDDNGLDLKESRHLGANGANSDNHNLELCKDERIKLRGESNSLSEIEILSNAMFILVVGLETTSTMLTHCFYALSFHPEVQEKLYRIVKPLAITEVGGGGVGGSGNKCSFDYDSLISCEYLDAVISESLRCSPPIGLIDRMVIEDIYLETHNIYLPAGSKVVFHLGDIMNDKDNWPEPERFDPERFMPGRREKIVPGSYCPFGLGPRHCLGMRFSLTESKLALAKLVMDFKFEPAPGLTFPPVMSREYGLAAIKRPEVCVVRRA